MYRRGYIISVLILILDVVLFKFGGIIVAVAAVIYSLLIGELIAIKSVNAVKCEPAIDYRHQKFLKSFYNVKAKIDARGNSIFFGTDLYVVPGEEINAYCFGGRSIGVTEAALDLDINTIEALIAHEMGHLLTGESIMNMVIAVNALGLVIVLAYYQFVIMAAVFIVICIMFFVGILRTTLLTTISSGVFMLIIHSLLKAGKSVILSFIRILIALIGRSGEFLADKYAVILGYGFYLMQFLKDYSKVNDYKSQTVFTVLYDTHPSPEARINRIITLQNKQKP